MTQPEVTLPEVTLLVPNYKTPELTKLCLRLIRKHTDLNRIKVIAIDNHSEDESVEYLRQLSWIQLIERAPEEDDTPALSHSRALDLALKHVITPYVLSIHTDTLIKNVKWLDRLLIEMKKDSRIAGVGSWKLESKPFHKRLAKHVEYYCQRLYYSMTGKDNHRVLGLGNNFCYLRSHCALYRTDLIRKHNLTFSDGHEPAGKLLHKKLIDHGYQMIFLRSEVLGQYLDHINHATMVLNPELGARKKTISKGAKRVEKALRQLQASMVLRDSSLDS